MPSNQKSRQPTHAPAQGESSGLQPFVSRMSSVTFFGPWPYLHAIAGTHTARPCRRLAAYLQFSASAEGGFISADAVNSSTAAAAALRLLTIFC